MANFTFFCSCKRNGADRLFANVGLSAFFMSRSSFFRSFLPSDLIGLLSQREWKSLLSPKKNAGCFRRSRA
jgi:hypothetical protein